VSFDRIARHYFWLETVVFGAALQRSRVHWIGRISTSKSVLVLGEGDGRFLCELVKALPDADIDCVEASPRMIERARERLRQLPAGSGKNVRFVREDMGSWAPPRSYDLLVTHFVLDCFPSDEIERIVAKLAHAASPGAFWLLSDFTLPAKGWTRVVARVLLSVMYAFFRITTRIKAKALVDPAPHLEKNGFVCSARCPFYAGIAKSELWRRLSSACASTRAPALAPQETRSPSTSHGPTSFPA
jgi:SAM-dependent methyltransferase